MENIVLWTISYWSLFLKIQLTNNHQWLRQKLGTKQVTSQYLNQWGQSFMTTIGITKSQSVNTVLWKSRAHGAKFKFLIIHDNIPYMKLLLCPYSPISNVQFPQSSWRGAGNHDILFLGSSGFWGPLEAASRWAENVWPPIGGFLDNDMRGPSKVSLSPCAICKYCLTRVGLQIKRYKYHKNWDALYKPQWSSKLNILQLDCKCIAVQTVYVSTHKNTNDWPIRTSSLVCCHTPPLFHNLLCTALCISMWSSGILSTAWYGSYQHGNVMREEILYCSREEKNIATLGLVLWVNKN